MGPRTARLAPPLLFLLAVSASAQVNGVEDAIAGFRAAALTQASLASRPKEAIQDQFAGSPERNQGAIGSCHAFAAVALLEAAYERRFHERIALAEEDLFLRRTVLSGAIYKDFCAGGTCALQEGGSPSDDISYVLGHGILTSRSYAAFAERYVKYRSAELKTMAGIEQSYRDEGLLLKMLYDPRRHWKELMTENGAKTLLSSYLEGPDSNDARERDDVRAKFAGFRVRSVESRFYLAQYAASWPGVCRQAGVRQREALTAELDRGRPVGVEMELAGLSAWNQADAKKGDDHAFVIVGYDAGKDGALVFHTRNSWGATAPDVQDAELCRIFGVYSVLAPGESAAF